MADVLSHRGPDQRGFHDEAHAALISTRLSIIDVDGGRMPISNEDSSLHIVYNGECFNFPELRRDLLMRGHAIKTKTDTEVVLHLYEEYGRKCLDMMNGQCAFAIWDSRRRSLFLARDRMGIRPLFYAEKDGMLVFGSEVKAIFATGLVRPQADLRGLDALTSFGCVVAPNTFFQGVRALPAGHYLEWRNGGTSTAQYWDIDYPDSSEGNGKDERFYAEGLFEELTEATRRRLIADVPVGAYLSGGLDSSSVVDRMAHLNGRPTTFGIVFDDHEFDEGDYINLMAGHVNSRHEQIRVSVEDIARVFPRLIRHAETPMVSTESAPLMMLSELAREKVKVVLTGEGADELLGGYSFDRFEKMRALIARFPWSLIAPFVKAHYKRQVGKHYGLFFPSREQAKERERLFGIYPSQSMQYGFFELLKQMTYTEEMIQRSESYDRAVLLPDSRAKVRSMEPFNGSLYLSQKLFLEGHLLAAHGDRAAMANSVETRYPFLDHNVVEFCAAIPPRLKMKWFVEKHILRAAFRKRLPAEILKRGKQSFLAPFGTPFLHERAPEAVKDLLSERSLRDKGYFEPQKVHGVVARLRELGETGGHRNNGHIMRLSGEKIERILLGMAVTFVVSVQLWDEAFLRGSAAGPGALPPASMPAQAKFVRRVPSGRPMAQPGGVRVRR